MKTALHKLEFGQESVAVAFARNNKARRYTLRFRDGIARVTIPRGGSLPYAQEFASKNRAWIEKQLRRAPGHWSEGTEILFRGEQLILKTLRHGAEIVATFSDQVVHFQPGDDLRLAVEARMRTLATKELTVRAWQLAREHGMEVSAVVVRNQRSRWGSCSVRKRISLNWRLIQTPEFVRDYIIIHELMHLKEMNHSDRFWTHVASAFPRYVEAELWLRKNSALLR